MRIFREPPGNYRFLSHRIVVERSGVRNPTSGQQRRFSSLRGAKRRSNPVFSLKAFGLLRCARNDGLKLDIDALLPCKYRLFQLGNAGIATPEHLAELVDQRCRRRVDELAGGTKPDHPPPPFSNADQLQSARPPEFPHPAAIARA